MNPSSNQDFNGSEDTRTRADFQPAHYPRVNGQSAPPLGARERNDRIKLEFLAVYYGLNCQHARLLELRTQSNLGQKSGEERMALQTVERWLITRDELEDRYAPFGVIAQPVVNDGFTVDLKISFGNVDAAGRLRSEMFTLTTTVPIPLPGGIRFKDLAVRIEGPGINPE